MSPGEGPDAGSSDLGTRDLGPQVGGEPDDHLKLFRQFLRAASRRLAAGSGRLGMTRSAGLAGGHASSAVLPWNRIAKCARCLSSRPHCY
jgi:hypothetical protein